MNDRLIGRRNMLKLAGSFALLPLAQSCIRSPLSELLKEASVDCGKAEFLRNNYPISIESQERNDTESSLQDSIRYGEDIENVDFFAPEAKKRERGQLSDGTNAYVISKITSNDTVSRDRFDCTGIIFVGKEKGSDQQIGFESHHDPARILYESSSQFSVDMDNRLSEFEARVEPNSISYIIFGGNYRHERNQTLRRTAGIKAMLSEHYVRSVVFLARIGMKRFPYVEPLVALGPNLERGPIHSRFKMQERKLQILAPIKTPAGYSVCKFPEYLQQLEKLL